MKTALISVFDKVGIVAFVRALVALGFNIISSGGTAKVLREAGIPVRDVAELVGGDAILGHRVVTLSREVHAGLLARDTPEDNAELEKLGIPRIDLVCVDMYPLEKAITDPNATTESVIENTDIGGPTMLSSAAKGRRIVVCDPADRTRVIEWLQNDRPDADKFVNELCAKADGVVAAYRLLSARFHSKGAIDGMVGTKTIVCKYGQNPSLQAAYYATGNGRLAIHAFKQVGGTEPSFINLTDLSRAVHTLTQCAANFRASFGQTPKIALAVKHGNCCGAAYGDDPCTVIRKMIESDPTSIHGATVLCNFPLDERLATELRTYKHPATKQLPKRLIDVVAATAFDEGAESVMERKAGKCRMFANPALPDVNADDLPRSRIRVIDRDGFLKEEGEPFILDVDDPRMEKKGEMTLIERLDLVFAHGIGSTSNSNTICLVKNGMLIALAVGQQSRVRAGKLALMICEESGHDPHGAIAYSDSFFPYSDGPLVLARAGIAGLFASSGSNNDPTVFQELFSAFPDLTFWSRKDKECRGFAYH